MHRKRRKWKRTVVAVDRAVSVAEDGSCIAVGWSLMLNCGHAVFVASITRPTMVTVKCAPCKRTPSAAVE